MFNNVRYNNVKINVSVWNSFGVDKVVFVGKGDKVNNWFIVIVHG